MATYKLNFTASITPAGECSKDDFKDMIERFMDLISNPGTFTDNWLQTTMGDVVPNEESDDENSLYDFNYQKVSNVEVDIWDEQQTFEDGEHQFVCQGTLSWTSIAVEKEDLEVAIDWRLGDRFSNYGMLDDDWYASFTPGELEVEAEEQKEEKKE